VTTPVGENNAINHFGRVLKRARCAHAADESLRGFAKLANYDPGYLSKVENGVMPATAEVVSAYDRVLKLGKALLDQFTAANASDQPPAGLPPLVPLVGREVEQQQIRAFVDDLDNPDRLNATRVLLISGPTAMGTSALATWAAHLARDRHPDGVHYVDLGGYGPAPHHPREPREVLGDLLSALKVSPVGDRLTDRILQYRTALASGPDDPRRILIVLDNARDAQQVTPLLPGAAAEHTTIIISSCQTMVDLVDVNKFRVLLTPLADQAAADLFRDLLAHHQHPIAARDDLLTELAAIAGGSPLVIRRTADELLTTRVDEPATDVVSDATRIAEGDSEQPSQIYNRLSWVLDAVSPDAARLFRLLGIWRSDQASLSAEALAALCGRGIQATKRVTTELVHAHLLQERDRDRYGMTRLAARYSARLVAGHDADDRVAGAHRLANWYLHSTAGATAELTPWRSPLYTPVVDGVRPHYHRNPREALAWLHAERAALLEASRVAMQSTSMLTECWQLTVALRGWLEIEPDLLDLWHETHERGYVAAVLQKDRIALATVQTQRAEGLRREAQPDKSPTAARDYDLALKIIDLAVDQWRQTRLHLPDSVASHYLTAYGGPDAVHGLLLRGEAWALRTAALLRRDHRYMKKARETVEAALTLLSPDHHEDMALTLGVLASILLSTPQVGRLQLAEKRLSTALDHLWHLGGASRIEAWIHTIRADLHLIWAREHGGVDHLAQARDAINESLAATRRTGDPSAESRLRARWEGPLADIQSTQASAAIPDTLQLISSLPELQVLDDVWTHL
jgi:hypothetical protein